MGWVVLAVCLAMVTSGCLTFEGTKEVTNGEGDEGPFLVEITCGPEGSPETTTITLEFEGDGDTNGTFPGFIIGPGTTVCTITETEQAGATSVTYECGDIDIDPFIDVVDPTTGENLDGGQEAPPDGGGPGASVARGQEPTADCVENPDGLVVTVMTTVEIDIFVEFTVINDFTPAPPTTVAPPPPTPAPVPPDPGLSPAGEVLFTG